MFLLIDNYDSFTYNLVQYFQNLGENPTVLFNDDPKILDLATSGTLEKVVISPGPSHPAKAGLCLEFLKLLPHDVPVLGVCLGHQVLGLFGGADVVVNSVIMHGMQSDIKHEEGGLFTSVPDPMRVGRYHSLVVVSELDDDPKLPFRVTARGPLGEVMALQYKDRPWCGVQFHPESVLTPEGMRLLVNFPQEILPGAAKAAPAVVPASDGEKPTLRAILERLACHQDLDLNMAQFGFDMLMDGEMTPTQTGAFLMGLRAKGETSLELGCAIRSVLARAVPTPPVPDDAIDVVGTGGDGRSSFNCSTCTCLTLAGMGYHVAKHGNRAVSSTSGAADTLSLLGLNLEKDPEKICQQIRETNFGFFFAPNFHPSFRHVGPARKEMGIRTLFNILGPMINPSKPPYLLMGVARPELVQLIADTLSSSPTLKRVGVVYGAGGYDEATPMGPAKIILLDHGRQTPMTLDPAEYGIPTCTPEDVAVHSQEEAVAVLKELLQGRGSQHMKNMVMLNVALSIFLIRPEKDMAACMKEAREAVESGAGRKFVK
ncbi:MAG: anthranilate phosphoribosyltransferase [Desulfovibrionaceae bacterium]|nr:anthranilate phosphoribosyltransferase [Desulfovibrionaceae bacterium]